ncbi:hypothetical protein DDB_G0290607 [Dictyostelium discoideum AX4]|uniref:Uncharacterized protein n=1 Tax=Dictyostelium discoideum TaxID=44689 RepID=Q54FS9_DICDI|nr:hypothetical protein DDB_G0290607 [Dictyostelium discoideum AX4]EAL62164.1 hypothetical protein DDB_G0290607 [Dictyostelium discoideum AX4]|eukprot:XP_635688.1 hypothetical protein DDB_G0290607 [Dictyostelium discoideum AX4]
MYIETKSEQGSLPLLVHLQNEHLSSRKVELWLVENKIYIPNQKRKDKRNKKKNQIKEKEIYIKVEDNKEISENERDLIEENKKEVSENECDLIEEDDDEILCEDDEIPCGQPISSEEDEPTRYTLTLISKTIKLKEIKMTMNSKFSDYQDKDSIAFGEDCGSLLKFKLKTNIKRVMLLDGFKESLEPGVLPNGIVHLEMNWGNGEKINKKITIKKIILNDFPEESLKVCKLNKSIEIKIFK